MRGFAGWTPGQTTAEENLVLDRTATDDEGAALRPLLAARAGALASCRPGVHGELPAPSRPRPGAHLFRPVHTFCTQVCRWPPERDETPLKHKLQCVRACARARSPGWPTPPTSSRLCAIEKNKKQRQKTGRGERGWHTEENKNKNNKNDLYKNMQNGREPAPPISSQRFLSAGSVASCLEAKRMFT